MGITLIKNRKHYVIKRDGRKEPYNEEKLKKVILWATDNNEYMLEELLKNINKKIYDEIKIQDLFDTVIDTAANLISTLYPQWDEVAKRLYLLKIYKETWNLKKTGKYPSLKEVIHKGLQHSVYSREVYESYTEEEIDELSRYMEPDRDFLFNYKGLRIFYEKYCLNYSKTQKLELPQLTYMRLAMFSFYKIKDKEERMKLVKDKYDMLSTFTHTEATPKMINAGTPTPQLSSCVLIETDDDTYSILETAKWEGIFSKYSGGCAEDVSRIRAVGGFIKGNRGVSSGVIPFIKLKEAVITAFNQGGKRKGSLVINYPFWHYESPDITYMKDAGGSEDKRARKLQYSVKWYRKFSKAIINKEEIYLFDPKDTPKLLTTYGEEFEKWYEHYSQKSSVRKRKIKATELAYDISKVRKETGNLYIVFIDNINEQRMGEEFIKMSNLCVEITLPTKAPKFKKSKIVSQFGNGSEYEKIEIIEPGEIALCNLASINLDWWYNATEEQKDNLIRNLLISFDEGIENQMYPVIDGMFSNKRRRPIGIGAFNLAKLFARLGILWTDESAKEIVHKVFEDLSWYILKHSALLAKERGHYETIKEGSKWQEGKVPLDVSILHNKIGNKRPDLNQKLYKDWDYIRDLIYRYGVRFSYHMAIAPTANSVKSINATESTEPVIELFTKEEGVFTLPNIVPGLNKGYKYQTAFEIPNKTLIELAAIRQKFIDQSQSVNTYYTKPTKSSEIIKDILYAEILGLKTLYYLKTPKGDTEEICESCAT